MPRVYLILILLFLRTGVDVMPTRDKDCRCSRSRADAAEPLCNAAALQYLCSPGANHGQNVVDVTLLKMATLESQQECQVI